MSAIANPAPQSGPGAGKPVPTPAAVPPERGFPWKLGVALVIVIGAVAAYQFSRRTQANPAAGVSIRTAKVATGTLIRSVRVSGQTSARNSALLTVPIFRGPQSRANLTLVKLSAAGSMVKKGDLVAQLDAQSAQEHVDDLKDQVAQFDADIRRRKADQEVDLGNLKQILLIAKSDLDKAQLEHRAAEVKTTIERELLRLNAEETEARYKELQKDFPNALASDKSELRIQEINRQKTVMQYERHLNDLQKFTFKAPMSGLVVMQPVFRSGEMAQIREGDQVQPGQPFMRIVDPASMQVEATANQSESSEFRLGQRAVVGLDAFPEVRLKGRIYSIGALAVGGRRENFYIRNVPVRVAIDGVDPRLIPDLSAWADVEVERHENVLLIPNEAIQSEGGKPFVYVKRGEQLDKRSIELGPRNAIQSTVASGLQAGELVALEAPPSKP